MVNEKDLKTKYLRLKNHEFTVLTVACWMIMTPHLHILAERSGTVRQKLSRMIDRLR
jgi:hypothetical protein